ncbi:LolA family protein [Croceivirga thetidis]|uniref:Outer membrane lipoprotein carrier protein LolA n=1 Tax=Croceivirga thetidis TaxID=2721623 RepID=A0ABX1GRB0_9FLAO|nr:outer membrane lipoprotein carrier protein LolA [Croceivirga thetidis]NKI32488.1 outer membrane lipoprotein carrier protein LolA [Croceivirga thetidis]
MKKVLFFLSIFTFAFTLNAQNSEKAKTLLDEVYTKVVSYENIKIDFTYSLENSEAGIKQETNGNVTLKGDNYLANLFGSTQLFDGKKLYTIVPENEEVTIEDQIDNDETVTPSKMLTFYKTGHNYAWDILQNSSGRQIQFIKLSPIDSNTEIKSILLGVDTQTKHIHKLIETGKNGTKTTITVNSFKTNQPLSKSLFTFDEAKYKNEGYYIIKN